MVNRSLLSAGWIGHNRRLWQPFIRGTLTGVDGTGADLGLKPKRRAGPGGGERLQAAFGKVMANRAKG